MKSGFIIKGGEHNFQSKKPIPAVSIVIVIVIMEISFIYTLFLIMLEIIMNHFYRLFGISHWIRGTVQLLPAVSVAKHSRHIAV